MPVRAAATVVVAVLAAALPAHGQRAATAPARTLHLEPRELARWQAILRIEDSLNASPADVTFLVNAARRSEGGGESKTSLDPHLAAVRALGRMERLDLVPALRQFLGDAELRGAAELGLLLTLRAHASGSPAAQVTDTVNDLIAMPASPVILGNLPLQSLDQFRAIEDRLRAALSDPQGQREAAARGLEALVRRNRRLGRLTGDTIEALEKGAAWSLPQMRPKIDEPIVVNSMAALLSAGVMTGELVAAAFREPAAEIRRLGAMALYAGGSSIEDARRTDLIADALKDREARVRYEALRAWVRWNAATDGCGPLLNALSDERDFVALAAIDALGEQCRDDEAITIRLVSEARTPPNGASWHRETRAFLALARRAPDRAAVAMPSFSRHLTWQVRMYAARAAAAIKDADTLAQLAYDADDNVRHAALPALRVLAGPDSDAAFIAALARDDYQLLRAAAVALKGAPSSRALLTALVGALDRVTAQKKDTSRDTRLALMAAIGEQAGRDAADVFDRLVTDYDPRVAATAAATVATLTGRSVMPAPRLLARPPPPTATELEDLAVDRLVARVDLDTGGSFDIALDIRQAPLTSVRVMRLARAQYYDGLTFHRVAPNFVVQGGSPRANEYAGDALYMPDELTGRQHATGTIGLSTRGHHTGDAQLFINLAENRTLEFEYTVFGTIVRTRGGADIEKIQEGTTIRRIRMVPPTP